MSRWQSSRIRGRRPLATERGSAIYAGTIRHRRFGDVEHTFTYGAYHLCLDLDEVQALDRTLRLFGHNRPALFSLRDRDHFGPLDVPLREKLARWLADRGHHLGDRRVLVVTNLRILGHVFNPVSWWYVLGEDDAVDLVVAEVNNTFGESYSYLLDTLEPAGPNGAVTDHRPKAFHVSPFQPISGEYGFVLTPPGERLVVHMDVVRDGAKAFDATVLERRVPLTDARLLLAFFRYPLMTLRTVGAIHFQALRLWLKRAPFFRKPAPPANGYPVADSAAGGALVNRTADASATNSAQDPIPAPHADLESRDEHHDHAIA